MMNQGLIDALDAGLAANGESVRLMRMATPPATGILMEVACMAVMRGYAPSEVAAGSGITQQDQVMIVSPSSLVAAGWPGAGLSPVPRKGDRVVTATGVMAVQAASGISVGGELVRIEAQVRGS